MDRMENAVSRLRKEKDRITAEYRELLAIPSISTLPAHAEDVLRAAQWLAAHLRVLKMDRVEIMETAKHPIVYAEWLNAPGKPTVLVYGHYDVQPADPLDEWDSDPFAAEIRGDNIYARGASDMKGQLFAFLKALEALLRDGTPPVNLKFLLEGEEEIGSPNLPGFIETHRDMLQCDFVLNCDAGIHAPDRPSIVYSLRGLAYFEIAVQGPGHDLHSGIFGGTVRNPIHVLTEVIAGMHDEKGRVTLPGFYDRVRPLDEEEREMLAAAPFEETQWLEMTGAAAVYGEEGYTTLERAGARPTLDVNGIWGGFMGEGAKTVLPAKASAKLSMRLVPDQRPEDIEGQLRAYLESAMPDGVSWKLEGHSFGPGAVMDRKSPWMRAAAEALTEVFGTAPYFKREGGSVPVVGLLQKKLGADSIMLGFALADDGIHGPNEKQHLPTLFRGMETYVRFLESIAQA
jgi:acetylornithine deacetylase/succinyl-diaminopimelate desuccinylase-like protein